jgi:hypothetical protein
MIDTGKFNEAIEILNSLPDEAGVVIKHIEDAGTEGDIRILSVEFKDQTIILRFVFDDTEEREEMFAMLLAKGAVLLRYFVQSAFDKGVDREDLLDAFNIVFNSLIKEVRELRDLISSEQEDAHDDEPPTVGEK